MLSMSCLFFFFSPPLHRAIRKALLKRSSRNRLLLGELPGAERQKTPKFRGKKKMLPEQQQQTLSEDDRVKIDTFLVLLQLGEKKK